MPQPKLLITTALIGAFLFSGCQFNPDEKNSAANILTSTFTEIKVDPREKYDDFLYSNPRDQEFYDQAYLQAEYHRPIIKPVFGGIIPYNPDLGPEIASFFHRLEDKGAEVERVVIIARNYGEASRHSKVSTTLPYETPYGLLEPDTQTISALFDRWVLFPEEKRFKEEKTISFFTPYIKRTFPNAKVVPILFEDNLSLTDAQVVGKFLARELGDRRTVTLAVSNFSNHPQFDLARFQTRYARSAIEAGEFYRLNHLNLDSLPAIQALNAFLNPHQAYTTIPHSKGIKDRGFVMEYFLEGAPRPSPEVTMIAAGDIMIDRYVRTLMERNTPDYPFEKISPQGLLRSGHIIHANLEGPVTDERPRVGDVIFKFDPEMIDILIRHGINLVTIANNHTLDQGATGFENTKKYLTKAGLAWVGHPLNETEGHTYITEINGLKIGFIGFHDATIRLDVDKAIADIKSLDPLVDHLVVTIHWGPEYVPASQRQKDLGHAFIDAGADAIVGHHPHVVQEIEWYNEKPIIYSLGNFIFDQYWSQATQKGLTIGLIFSPNNIELYEFPISLPKSQPALNLPTN